MKKYLLVPGRVTSKNDGNVHYVSSADLMHMYRVRPYECVVFPPGHETPEEMAARYDLRILRPRFDGNYKL